MIAYSFADSPAPYNSKNIIPVGKIEVTQTPYTVKSLGLNLSRYVLTGNLEPDFEGLSNLILIDSGVSPLIGMYSGGGPPPGFSTITKFAYKYTGYFYARQSGIVNFNVIGNGFLKLILIGTEYVLGNSGNYVTLDPKIYQEGAYFFASAGFNPITIYYYTNTQESGFALLWKNNEFWGDNSDIYNYGLPVSAGITSTTSSFLTEKILSDVSDISISQSDSESSTLSFSLPLGELEGSFGYYYDISNDYYVYNPDNNLKIKRGWLVQGFVGYKNSLGTKEYIKKFTGNIDKLVPKRDKKNRDYISVECIGFENFLNTSLNMNYPDEFDYWISGYAGKTYSKDRPEGIQMPTTYDNWELSKAVQSLMIRGYIDPVLFLKRKQHLNTNGDIINGSFLMKRASPTFIYLDKNRNYGSPFIASNESDSSIDSSYVIESNFGDYLTDYINKIVDTYGWKWGFSDYYDGAPLLFPTNNPTGVKFLSDGTLVPNINGAWSSTQYDLDAIKGEYKYTVAEADAIEFSFTGERADFVPVLSLIGGTCSKVVSGSTSSSLNVTVGTGINFAIGQIIVVQMEDLEESSVIQSIDSDTLNILPSLTRIPATNSYVKTATYSVEIRRGTLWDTATFIYKAYHSCAWDTTDYSSFEKIGMSTQKQMSLNDDIGYLRYYYQGIDPRIARNPCKQIISGGLPYDSYLVRITRLDDTEVSSDGKMGVNALFYYETDPTSPVAIYRTGDSVANGTIVSLEIEDTGKDQRNDTIVVGRRIGTEVAGIEGSTVNPNNPYYSHIMSRGMDIGSIMDSSTVNFVGRPLQTIQIVPELASEYRADHWASIFINRYRKAERSPSYTAICNPLLEKGDCIAIEDEGKNLIKDYNKLWIRSIETKLTNTSVTDTISTSSYEPWNSYEPRPQITNLDNFGGLAISNLIILQTNGNITSVSDPYDPYTSQETIKNYIEITYDLNIDADIKIDIMHESGIRVATLLNPNTDAANKGWCRQTIGKNYKVTWDGVDMYGDWNTQTPQDEYTTIGAGFYVAEKDTSGRNYEKFFVKFTIKEVIENKPIQIIVSQVDFEYPNQWIYTRRGEKVVCSVKMVPAYMDPSTYKPPIGFFSDTLTTSSGSFGVRLGISSTNSVKRPSQCVIDVDAICFGISNLSIYYKDVPGVAATAWYYYSVRTTEDSLLLNETFRDFQTEYSFYYDPLHSGYLFNRTDPAMTLEAAIDYLDPAGHSHQEYDRYNDKVYLVGWYFIFKIKLTDASGRSSTVTKYTRWEGPNISSWSNNNSYYTAHCPNFKDAWNSVFGNTNTTHNARNDHINSVLSEEEYKNFTNDTRSSNYLYYNQLYVV